MNLPWFAFHIEKYLSDTMTLDTEGHGAYLLLMLHYYGTGKPPRDNDRTLAAIARLPMNRWLDRRPDIEAFFEPRDGLWHHPFIEAELLVANSKHAKSKAKAEAAAAAMHAKRGHKPASSQPQAKPQANPKPKSASSKAPSTASSQLEASPEPNLEHAHLHKHSTITVERESSLPEDALQVQEEHAVTLVSEEFWPCDNHVAVARIDGATDDELMAEVTGFVAHHQERGSFSNDWDATWVKWWKRRNEHKAKQAAKEPPKPQPRIEVNAEPDWDSYAKMWLSIGRWPSMGAGGEPGMQSCRCPADVLQRHGIDPVTGLKVKERA